MAISLSTVVAFTITANRDDPAWNTLADFSILLDKTFGTTYSNGTGAGKANMIWWNQATLDASAHTDIDLAGALIDPYGLTITFTKLKTLLVSASAANGANVLVGGAGANAVAGLFAANTNTAVLRPGATLAWIVGNLDATAYAVTASTGDLVRITNSDGANPATYDIFVVGEGSAA